MGEGQAEPLVRLGLQSGLSHQLPEVHCASAVQDETQASPEHAKGEQSVPEAARTHDPVPLQICALTRLPSHTALPQLVPLEYSLQLPAPSHMPSFWQVVWPSSAQSLCGSRPAAARPHVPVPEPEVLSAAVQALQG